MASSSQQANPWFGISMGLVGIIVGYGIAIVHGGGFITPQAKQPPAADTADAPAQPTETYDALIPFDPNVDHYRGNPNATIALIEYSDYECPFCQRHHPTMQQVMDEYGDDVVWIYRHYPLSFHPTAEPTAIASECVAEMGGNEKFWEFTDLVFSQGSDLAKQEGYVTQIGLDPVAFKSCVDSGKYKDAVNQSLSAGTAAGVRGTPGTFVVNTKTEKIGYISGAQPFANVKSTIDGLL